MTTTARGRVLRIVGGTYHVEADGEELECVLAGRVKKEGDGQVAVGDRVEVERVPGGACRIVEVLPRESRLARKSVARRREQVIAANIEQVAAVFSVREPEPDTRMLDRLLALAELNDLDAFVVLNKTDLLDGEGLPDAFGAHERAGYEVLPTSVPAGAGIAALRERLAGRITVLTGPSGAGKSSLLNAIVPGLDLRVGRVSPRKGRGRHTTVNAALHPLPGGGYVADTPGLQYVEMWNPSAGGLAGAFPEFRPWLGDCRFNDCRHLEEPGCAVLDALERGEIARSRYESYVSLLREAEEAAERW